MRSRGPDQPKRRLATRVLLLVGAGLVAAGVSTLAATDAAPADAAGVARMLAGAVGGDVAEGDFVWAPSGGALVDAFSGRWVAFVARTEGETNRDVWVARVHLTRRGRPFDVGGLRRITDTPFGDENDVDVAAGHLGFATDVGGRRAAITILPDFVRSPASFGDGGAALVQVSFDAAGGAVAYEIGERDVLLSFGGGALAARVVLESGMIEREAGVVATASRLPASALVVPTPRSLLRRVEGERWPSPSDHGRPASDAAKEESESLERTVVRASDVAGADPYVIAQREATSPITVHAFDMRQLDAAVVAGHPAGASRSGIVAPGTWPSEWKDRVVAVIRGPMVDAETWAGVHDNHLIQPPSPADDVVSSHDGRLRISPLGVWPAPFDVAIQFPVPEGERKSRRAALCTSDAGQLAYVSGDGTTSAALLGACHRWGGVTMNEIARVDDGHAMWVIPRGGGAPLLEVGPPSADAQLDGPSEHHRIVLFRHVDRAAVGAAADLAWQPLPADQPTPAFLPAIFEATTEELGEPVRLVRVAADRLEWRLRAGTEERSHREGGDFPEELVEAERPRALFAFSVGVGKRRGPSGLRIDGSTGHRFREGASVLSLAGNRLEIGSQPRGNDAVELPVSVSDGQITSRARERGPRQRRTDLCVRDDGGLLLAEATFDSHEVGATVLARLGCQTALALDRGAERESWSQGRTSDRPVAGPTVETALIGLDAPLQGNARILHIGN